MSEQRVTVALPSLIHRIGRSAVTQAQILASQHQCELKRVRRSRNWQLSGQSGNLQLLATQLNDADPALYRPFIGNKITQALQTQPGISAANLPEQLNALLRANPALTLAELMAKTNCSLAQARAARDAAEMQEF